MLARNKLGEVVLGVFNQLNIAVRIICLHASRKIWRPVGERHRSDSKRITQVAV